ncbi:MAG TPA: hypothetical protein VGR37_12455 [Longimicrobiaceae bacterium]|nr:hypothetical protein [Longimicrobiaceae bacterium]
MNDQPLRGNWAGEAGEIPPSFFVKGNVAVPIDAVGLHLEFSLDIARRRAHGRGRLRFTLPQPGRPLLDLVPDPTQLVLEGQSLSPERLRLVAPPDETAPLRMLDEPLAAGVEHELDIRYPLPKDVVGFGDGGVRLGLFMTDLDPRGYLERYAPANLEFDQLPMTMEVRVSGSSRAHRLFTNGQVTSCEDAAWQVTFPDYFTCSSCYLHLTDAPLAVREGTFAGVKSEVPVTIYGEDTDEVERTLMDASGILRELECTYGPYAHEALLVYCTGEIGGGMEYAGATMTQRSVLGNEITHSWFARGVMPANGNAGWIDEAIASWRDQGYPRAEAAPLRPPVQLAGFSPYRRHTHEDSYCLGSLLLSELDLLFAPGGLLPVLAKLFCERKRRLITTASFQAYLEQETGVPLGAVFDRYVYGKADADDTHPPGWAMRPGELFRAAGLQVPPSPPPRSFTAAELRSLL